MSRRHFFLLALIPLLLFSAWHYLSPAKQLRAHQQRLIESIGSKDEPALTKLLHPDYTDQWGFSPTDWPAILKDLRALSPILEIVMVNPDYNADAGVVDTALQAKSTGGPAAEYIQDQSVGLKEPTRFTWKRTSWLPWSWKLVNIQNPSISIPSSYRPGKFSASGSIQLE